MSKGSNRKSNIWLELKRRNVIRRNTVFAATAFVILELISIVEDPLNLPEWTLKVLIVLLSIGLIISLVLSWLYKITPEGIEKTKPSYKEKKEEKHSSSNAWKIASYLSFVIIIGLVLLHLISRNNRIEERVILDKSIAVLPFKSLSDEPEKQYLADGVMDALVLHLSKIEDLRVMSRTSVEQYRETDKTAGAICQELEVAYLLEGSFQKYGDQARIIVQLIEPSAEGHLWGNEYDREWKDILSVQSEVAQAIAAELQAAITPEERDLIEKLPTTNLTAYDFYQRAREEHIKYTLDNGNNLARSINIIALERAETLYLKALEYDTTFARAYSGLAKVYSELHSSNSYFSDNYLDSVLILCNTALSYDNQLAEAYTGRGYYYYENQQMQKAIEECDKAIKFNPNDWLAYYYKGIFYSYSGSNFINAIQNLYKARSLHRDESLPDIFFSLGRVYAYTGFTDLASQYFEQEFELDGDSVDYFEGLSYIEGHILGNYKEAIELSLQGLSIDSNDTRLLGNMGKFLMFLEQYDESLKYYEKLLEHLPKWGDVPQGFLHRVAFVYQMNGFEAEANYYFDRLISECNRSIELGRRYSASEAYYDLASTYALKGERAEAYKNLNMFVNSGQNARYFITLLKDDPFFDKLRNEAEFQNILKDMEAASMVERQKIRNWLEENNLL